VSGAARPVALALAEAARQPATLDPGDHAPDHPAIAYSDNWRVTPEGADPARTGDRLSFSFEGTGAALQVQGGPFWGVYRIWVDGQPANALPRDTGGAAYVVLYDPSGEARLVDVARGLPDGPHRLELVAEGGWGQWALQGVRIYGPEAIARGWIGWLLLVLAGLGTGLWVLLAAPELARRSAAGLDALAAYPDPLYWAIGAGLLVVLVLSSAAALDLAALAGLGLLFLVRPDAALPWLAFSLPFWPRPEVLLGRQFSHFELLVWLGLLALLARSLLAWTAGRGRPRGISGLDWPALAFVGIGLLAALAAEHRGLALREFRTVFLDAALFYALLTRAPAPEGRMYSPWPVVNGLLLGAAIVSLLALWQGLTGQGRIEVEGVWRVRALYGSPNNLALYLDRVVPLAAALAAFGARRRWYYALVALLSAAACLATFSKGAWLLGLPVGLAVVLLGGAWRTRRRWPVAALAGLSAAGVAGVALLARTPRMAGLFNFRSGTSFLRLQLWQSAWRMGLEHLALGVGPDNFLYAYRTRYVLPAAWEELNLNHPHNVVLDLWTRLGLLGLAAGAWLAAATGRAGWRLFRDSPTELWPLALGLLAGLAAGLAHGLIDNSLFLVDLMALLLLAAGLFERAREALVVSS
jgi:O-antigen ligase